MKFSDALIPATLVKRYKRFLSDHKLKSNGQIVTAHCPNPGSMMGLTEPGSEVWLSPVSNPNRKLRYGWELIRTKPGVNGLVGINTMLPNKLAVDAIRNGKIAELRGYKNIRKEVAYGTNSRIDILLEGQNRPDCYVEVKNVHFMRSLEQAEFPDSVTARGTKHLNELANLSSKGVRTVTLYIIQRADCNSFRIAHDIDPKYFDAFKIARNEGMEALSYSCSVTTKEIRVQKSIPVDISP